MPKIRVLYICHSTNLDGAAWSLFNMIHSLEKDVHPIVLFSDTKDAYQFFREHNIECMVQKFICNTQFKKNALYNIAKRFKYLLVNTYCIAKVVKVLQKKQIQIVHTNSSIISIGRKLAKKLRARHVWHFRELQGKDSAPMVPLLGWKRFYASIRVADRCIAITKKVFEHYKLYENKNSFIVWDAIRAENDISLNKNKKNYFLFCAANITEAKGSLLALEAFIKSRLWEKGYELYFLGKTDDKTCIHKLMHMCKEYGIEKKIKLLGFTKSVKKYMENACAFLMCSKNEGLGRVSVEAMFYGCPVIAVSSGGGLEFMQHNKNCFLFDSAEECAALMQQCAHEDVFPVITYAQKFAMENFSEKVYRKKLLSIYGETLSGST